MKRSAVYYVKSTPHEEVVASEFYAMIYPMSRPGDYRVERMTRSRLLGKNPALQQMMCPVRGSSPGILKLEDEVREVTSICATCKNELTCLMDESRRPWYVPNETVQEAALAFLKRRR